jgi:hypothetical protein
VDAEHRRDLLLREVSLAFNQGTDGVDISSVTSPLGPGQINKVGALAIEGCGPILATRTRLYPCHRLPRARRGLPDWDMLEPYEVNHDTQPQIIPARHDADHFRFQ